MFIAREDLAVIAKKKRLQHFIVVHVALDVSLQHNAIPLLDRSPCRFARVFVTQCNSFSFFIGTNEC